MSNENKIIIEPFLSLSDLCQNIQPFNCKLQMLAGLFFIISLEKGILLIPADHEALTLLYASHHVDTNVA